MIVFSKRAVSMAVLAVLSLPLEVRAQTSLLAAPSAPAPAEDPRRAEARGHAIKGQQYFAANRLADAEAEFKAAVAADPTWYDQLLNLGLAYDADGKAAEAVEALRAYLPHATPAEEDQVRSRIAQLEIRAEDQRRELRAKEAAEAEKREQQEREHARERAAAEEHAQRVAAQVLTITAEGDTTARAVTVRTDSGKAAYCEPDIVALDATHPCVIHGLMPGPATISMQGPDGDERFPIVIGLGAQALVVHYERHAGAIIAGGALMLVGTVVGAFEGATASTAGPKDDTTVPVVLSVAGFSVAVTGAVMLIYGVASQGYEVNDTRPSAVTDLRLRAAPPASFEWGVVAQPHAAGLQLLARF